MDDLSNFIDELKKAEKDGIHEEPAPIEEKLAEVVEISADEYYRLQKAEYQLDACMEALFELIRQRSDRHSEHSGTNEGMRIKDLMFELLNYDDDAPIITEGKLTITENKGQVLLSIEADN